MGQDIGDIPETGSPYQGRIVPQFEVTNTLLEKARNYVMNSKTLYESQRTSNPETDTNRKSFRERLRQMDRAYRAQLESDRPYKGLDDKAAPIIHDNVESIVARLKESIIPTNEEIIKVKSESLPYDVLKIRNDQLNTQWEKNNADNKIEDFIRSCVKFGTGIIRVPLENKNNQVLTQQVVVKTTQEPIIDENGEQMIDANGQPMFHVEQQQSIEIIPHVDKKYFGPGYDVIEDIEDIFVDRFIEDIQDQPIVIQRMLVTWDHLMEGVEKGIYFGDQVAKIKDMATSSKSSSLIYDRRSYEVVGISQFSGGQQACPDGKPKEYEMFQAWADFQMDEELEDGTKVKRTYPVVISVIGNECIQLMPNPFFHQMKPFIKGNYRRIEGEFYGLSAIDPVLDMYLEYNDTMNQIHDGKVLMINPITIVRSGAVSDKQPFNVHPGAVWFEKEQNDIRQYNISFPIDVAQQYLELLEQRINRGMGITTLMMGQGDATDLDKTWRGTNKLIAQADKKFKMIAKNLEDCGVRQWAELAYKINIQFTPLNIGVDEFENINSEVDFEVDGVETFFKLQEMTSTYVNFTQQVAAIPGFNIVGLVMTIADMQGIEIDEQKYGPMYTPPQPPPPEDKPVNTSVSMPIDMSKGPVMMFVAAQLLKQKGIDIDIDSVAEAQRVFTYEFDSEAKEQSGLMPASYDSYRNKETKKVNKKAKKDDMEIEVEEVEEID